MLPVFALFYGINPWEGGDLTLDEIDEFVRHAKTQIKQQAKGR